MGCAVTPDMDCDYVYSLRDIAMKNCGAYNVYYLKPPPNYSTAYCMGWYYINIFNINYANKHAFSYASLHT